ncbi:MAG TPA: NB-ARC domain-containing protein, partial [Chloroflexaceae bacterium]|nr:NB-ARC domain-containing protein [Chloroflexaceae bacterium]
MEPTASLPRAASSFVGREGERRAVAELLRRGRLLTLTGPGGAGKTRLAMEVAADLAGEFAEGVAVVALANVRRADAVLPAVALALGLRDQGARSPYENLVRHLRGRELLLVLDNFEQVAAAAEAVAALLAATEGPRLLVTSRGALRISGEQEFPVAPLALPPEGEADSPAVRLFVDRARAVRPDFALTAENAATVAAICRRLDGLPLAIELAAARTRLMPPAALLARLGRPLDILTGGPRDLPARHQTLRDAIAWSYELLEADEQRLLRRLASFSGGFSLGAVEAVCGDGDDGRPALELLAALADKSLIAPVDSADEPRFTMLETIREYAADLLAASGEAGLLRGRHGLYYVELAEAADRGLAEGQAQPWLARLDAERSNLEAALAALMDPTAGEEPEPALRLAAALARYWWGRGQLREGYAWLQAAIARSSGGLPIAQLRSSSGDRRTDALLRARVALRVDVLISAGEFVRDLDGPMAAAAFHESALGLARELGDRASAARALGGLGAAAFARGDYHTARARIEESLELYATLDRPWQRATTLNDLSFALYWLGEFDRVRALSGESLAVMARLGDPRGEG